MKWLGAIRQQAITWANVDPDLCRHMASLGHNELKHSSMVRNGSGSELTKDTPCLAVIVELWVVSYEHFNPLAPGRCASMFKSIILEHMLQIKFMIISCEISVRWMPQNTFDDRSTLVQVMAWCLQATSHYLKQCWPPSPTIWRH